MTRQSRSLSAFQRRPYEANPADDERFAWIEPVPGKTPDLAEQIGALAAAYLIVEARLKYEVRTRAVTAAYAAELLNGIIDARETLEDIARNAAAAKPRKSRQNSKKPLDVTFQVAHKSA